MLSSTVKPCMCAPLGIVVSRHPEGVVWDARAYTADSTRVLLLSLWDAYGTKGSAKLASKLRYVRTHNAAARVMTPRMVRGDRSAFRNLRVKRL